VARIDTYLDNLERHRAQGLVLGADQSVQLLVDGEVRRLRKTCSTDEILTLVHEVMDAATRRQFVVDGSARFAYRHPTAGPLSIAVERSAAGLRCEVQRVRGRREVVEG
jgi:Tfp pilus assembly ATPase PilU